MFRHHTMVAQMALAPLVRAFFRMKLVRREVVEDGDGKFWVKEVRRDSQGERLRYTYPLDTPITGD